MAKKAVFSKVVNADGESDQRVSLEESSSMDTAVPAQDSDRHDKAHLYLDQLANLCEGKQDEEIKQLGIHPVHLGLIREFSEKKKKGKQVLFSDGNIEMLELVHKKVMR